MAKTHSFAVTGPNTCGIPFNLNLNLALASSQESFASEDMAGEAGDRALAQFVKPVTGEQ